MAHKLINEYIEKYGKRLFGLCVTLCKNTYDAEDLYQETWLKVVSKISQYNRKLEFEPWLTRICVNTYRDKLRRNIISPIFDMFNTTEEKEAIINTKESKVKEDFSEVHYAVNGLPQKLRITVILYYFFDMDINKISETINIPPGTVKSRLNKARKLLKEVLKDEFEL